MNRQKSSISEIYQRESTRLRRFVGDFVPNLADAEDIIQDVFVEFLRVMDSINPVDQAGAWLFRVARNRLTDRFRRRQRSIDAGLESANPNLTDLQSMLPGGTATPDLALEQERMLAALELALEAMPEPQRRVYLAHEVGGRSFAELASESGESINTLLSRKRYALMFLRRHLSAAHEYR